MIYSPIYTFALTECGSGWCVSVFRDGEFLFKGPKAVMRSTALRKCARKFHKRMKRVEAGCKAVLMAKPEEAAK